MVKTKGIPRVSTAFDRVVEVTLRDRSPALKVGTLAERNREILFEYDAAFLELGLELSPAGLPLTPGVHREKSGVFGGLHGLFHDSLPDGWGLRVMDREFARINRDPATVTPLERLQFLGTRGMGALAYQPAKSPPGSGEKLDLDQLAAQSQRIFEGSPEEVLPALVAAGGSAAGARPKVLVAWNPVTNELLSGTEDWPEGFTGWLVKFPTREDGADAGAIEMAYAAMAREAGIDFPRTHLFITNDGRRCFGVERFDRIPGSTGTESRHVHTLCGLLHASHREFGCTYGNYLAATDSLTKDRRQLVEAFRRMVFNVLANNRDDHVKNFAFLMQPDGSWQLSPAYDLTYSPGPGGEHSMMVGTESSRPAYRNFLEVGNGAGLTAAEVHEVADQVRSAVSRFEEHARKLAVLPESIERISAALARAGSDARRE